MQHKSFPIFNLIKALAICCAFCLMVTHPAEVLVAAQKSLETWWKAVLPALLPFFVLTELMNTYGINQCLGIWLEPVMQPIFRLPGSAAIAVVIGFAAGTPAGAVITADLRRKKLITQEEGERLLAFTNNAGAFFILSVTAGGVLGAPELGAILLLSHYAVNLIFGILLRFSAPKTSYTKTTQKHNRFTSGLQAVNDVHKLPVAAALTAAMKKSLQTIGIIACYMLICSIIASLLKITGITNIIVSIITPLLQHLGINPAVAEATATGMLEMSIGIATLPASGASLLDMTMAAALILAFNGLSIQAQVAAMISDTDLHLRKYMLFRIIHTLIAPLVVLSLWYTKTPAAALLQPTGVNMLGLCSLKLMLFPVYTLMILLGITIVIVMTKALYQVIIQHDYGHR